MSSWGGIFAYTQGARSGTRSDNKAKLPHQGPPSPRMRFHLAANYEAPPPQHFHRPRYIALIPHLYGDMFSYRGLIAALHLQCADTALTSLIPRSCMLISQHRAQTALIVHSFRAHIVRLYHAHIALIVRSYRGMR